MQAEKLTWSLRVKILWSTGEFFSCLFDLQNVCGQILLIDRNDISTVFLSVARKLLLNVFQCRQRSWPGL